MGRATSPGPQANARPYIVGPSPTLLARFPRQITGVANPPIGAGWSALAIGRSTGAARALIIPCADGGVGALCRSLAGAKDRAVSIDPRMDAEEALLHRKPREITAMLLHPGAEPVPERVRL